MYYKHMFSVGLTALVWASSVHATGPYTATIELLQATDIGNHHNTVFLNMNITDSPCSSTNTHDRFTITSEVQFSAVLAALMSGKSITIHGTGSCNASNIETISNVRIEGGS